MNKEHLIETQLVECEILEKESEERGGLTVKLKWQHGGKINNNNRRYRKEILEREIARIQEDLKQGRVFGCAYHPKSGDAEVPDVAMIWREAKMLEDGTCIGKADILPTHYGKDAITIIRAGGAIGISSRGYGTTSRKTEKGKIFSDVNDDFFLKTPGDIVLSPSVEGAGIKKLEKLIENQANNFDTEELNDEERMLRKKKRLEMRYNEAVDAGYTGSIEEFKKIAEISDARPRLLSLYKEAVFAGFSGNFFDWYLIREKYREDV